MYSQRAFHEQVLFVQNKNYFASTPVWAFSVFAEHWFRPLPHVKAEESCTEFMFRVVDAFILEHVEESVNVYSYCRWHFGCIDVFHIQNRQKLVELPKPKSHNIQQRSAWSMSCLHLTVETEFDLDESAFHGYDTEGESLKPLKASIRHLEYYGSGSSSSAYGLLNFKLMENIKILKEVCKSMNCKSFSIRRTLRGCSNRVYTKWGGFLHSAFQRASWSLGYYKYFLRLKPSKAHFTNI